MEKVIKSTIGQIFLILAIGIFSIWFASLFVKGEKSEDIAKEVVEQIFIKKPSCPSTSSGFSAIRETGQIVSLAENINSYGSAEGNFVNPKITVVNSSGSGSEVSCGYLYVKAHGKNGRPLQLEWEHPYVKPGQFGGHLITNESILPSINKEAEEFLFNLSSISYKETNAQSDLRKADWAALLNVSDRIVFEIALNTTDTEGVLEDVSIVYQCWSPETGQITKDCKLTTE
jgi:hypothetical protein